MKKKTFLRKKNGERSLPVRIFAIVVVLMIIFAMVFTMLPAYLFAAEDVETVTKNSDGSLPLVVDYADILTDEEEAEIEAGLQAFREEQNFDIVVLTVHSLNGYGVVDYADDFYDYNGYGGGDDHDGALILVSTEYRDWTMSTTGYGITAVTDYSLDQIEEEILPDLSAGRYATAFKKFGDHVAYCVREARNGNIIDEFIPDEEGGTHERGDYPLATNLGIAGFFGALVSFLSNARQKAALKSVHHRTKATEYIRKDSLRLTESRERYLYTTMNRIPIKSLEDDDDRPGHFGGSTIHMGSSGTFHGGGRPGKF